MQTAERRETASKIGLVLALVVLLGLVLVLRPFDTTSEELIENLQDQGYDVTRVALAPPLEGFLAGAEPFCDPGATAWFGTSDTGPAYTVCVTERFGGLGDPQIDAQEQQRPPGI